jgi:hypothetical protein
VPRVGRQFPIQPADTTNGEQRIARSMQVASPGKAPAAFVLLLVGSVILLLSLVQGWYTTSLGSGSSWVAQTFYPTTLQYLGSQSGGSYSYANLYGSVGFSQTGLLYTIIAGLIVLTGTLGIVSALLIRRAGGRARRRLITGILAGAVILAATGPILVAAAQPHTLCSDYVGVSTPFLEQPSNTSSVGSPPCGWDIVIPASPGGHSDISGLSPGPQTSFFGSDNLSGQYHTWGPSVGWYMAWAACGILLLGTLLYVRPSRGSRNSAQLV